VMQETQHCRSGFEQFEKRPPSLEANIED
jgi:hypothetical protein